MKKIISIVLVLLFVLALTSCGESQKAKTTTADESIEKGFNFAELEKDEYAGQFRAGFSRSSIMPQDTRIPMAGYGNSPSRLARGYLSELFVHCIAVSDTDNNTVLLMQVDNIGTPVSIAQNIYNAIEKRCGVPGDNVIFQNTHTHSAVDLNYAQFSSVAMYINFYINTLVNNAILAMNDRSPVSSMYYGNVQVPNHSFVRHYWGEVNGEVRAVGDNHNMEGWYSEADASVKRFLGHVSENDQTCHLVKFDRVDENKKDIMFLNFRCHNHLMGSTAVNTHFLMTADWAGEIVKDLESRIPDVYCCYLQGDAGDLNPTSYYAQNESTPAEDIYVYGRDMRIYATTFNDYVVPVYDNLEDIGTGKVGGKSFGVTLEYNHDMDGYLNRAYLVQEYWKTHQNDSAGTKRYAMTLGIYSQYHASKIISNANSPKEHTVNHRVCAIGNVGITCTSGELFNQLGVKARSENPFEIPLSFSYTGGGTGYYPSAEAYEYGCYEVDNNSNRKGSSEKVLAAQEEAIKELYKRLNK